MRTCARASARSALSLVWVWFGSGFRRGGTHVLVWVSAWVPCMYPAALLSRRALRLCSCVHRLPPRLCDGPVPPMGASRAEHARRRCWACCSALLLHAVPRARTTHQNTGRRPHGGQGKLPPPPAGGGPGATHVAAAAAARARAAGEPRRSDVWQRALMMPPCAAGCGWVVVVEEGRVGRRCSTVWCASCRWPRGFAILPLVVVWFEAGRQTC